MTPAFSIDAEEALLGALMLDPDAAGQIECDLQAGHFYREDHRRIYTAIRLLLDGKKAADPASLCDALEAAGEPPAVLTRAMEVAASVYSTAGTRRHAEIIVERSMLRNLQATADKIMCLADDMAGTVREKIDTAQKLVMELSDRATLADREPKRVRDLLGSYLETVGKRWEKSGGSFDTGFPDLDKRMNGGLAPGALVILAARPGMGKTALALQLAEHFAERDRPALVLSQEMQSVQLIDRTVAFVGRIDLSKILTGDEMTDDDHERFAAAVSRLENLPLVLDEQGSLRIEDVRRKARQTKARHGLGLVVIDYLQLMVGDGENRTREITEITGALKGLAKELDIPILALSQLNRGVEQRPNKRPVMSDLRESGSIEQDADVIMALYRDEYYDPDSMDKGLAELLILKNRQGKTGGFVPLTYHGAYTRFDSMFGDWPERAPEERAPSGRGRKSGAFNEKA